MARSGASLLVLAVAAAAIGVALAHAAAAKRLPSFAHDTEALIAAARRKAKNIGQSATAARDRAAAEASFVSYCVRGVPSHERARCVTEVSALLRGGSTAAHGSTTTTTTTTTTTAAAAAAATSSTTRPPRTSTTARATSTTTTAAAAAAAAAATTTRPADLVMPADADTADACATLDKAQLAVQLTSMRDSVIATASHAGAPLTWAAYAAAPAAHAGRLVRLTAADFAHGTLFIETSGVFQLTEDVEFSPNADAGFVPTAAQLAAASPRDALALQLGFFAAIAVAANHVVVDLNGHTLRASRAFALQQRFFSLVQLGSAPFVDGQGPADFVEPAAGAPFVAAHNVVVRNGVIGLSAHHGVHGTGAPRRVLLEQLVVRDFEVAGIAFNGARDVVVRHVTIERVPRVPVRGTYSAARQLLPVIDEALANNAAAAAAGGGGGVCGGIAAPNTPSARRAALVAARDRLVRLMDDVFDDVVRRGAPRIDAARHPEAAALFGNRNDAELTPDGSAVYGIAIVSAPIAVGGFAEASDMPLGGNGGGERRRDFSAATGAAAAAAPAGNILLQDVKVRDLRVAAEHILALRDEASGALVRGARGELFDIASAARDDATGAAAEYAGDALTDVHLALAAWARCVGDAAAARWRGTLAIADELVQWRDRRGGDISPLVASRRFRVLRNGDIMFHVMKGAIGVRLDGVERVCARALTVDGVVNQGAPQTPRFIAGEPRAAVNFRGPADGAHPSQGSTVGYSADDARGISVAASRLVTLANDVDVRNVTSLHGYATGVDYFNGGAAHRVHALRVDHVVACPFAMGSTMPPSAGVRSPRAIGVAHGADVAFANKHALVAADIANVTTGSMLVGCAYHDATLPSASADGSDGKQQQQQQQQQQRRSTAAATVNVYRL